MTTDQVLAQLRQRVEDEYCQRTPKSRALFEQAVTCLPGGDTRAGQTFRPHPTYIEHGEGSYLHDVDGNALLDFTNNATSLIHGHAHPEIVRALQQQAARGTAAAAPNSLAVRLAQILCERVPSLERVRFCNSGTEANMGAIKVARAFTGRDKILKMDGAYHGTYEGVEFNGGASAETEPSAPPRPRPAVRGIPRNAADNVLIAPYGDGEAAARLIAENRDDLAAVVVNPVLTRRGLELPPPGYLARLREVTRDCGVLLIFDEVITLRIAPGGAQEYYGVVPDLTAMGKIIGGGLPVGAFGGRADIMQLFVDGNPPSISHAGTFNGNPMTMAAGLAAMELLTPAVYQRIAGLGDLLRGQLEALLDDLDIAFEVNAVASLVSLGLSPAVLADRSVAAAAAEIQRLIQLALLNRGVKTYSIVAVSTVMTEAEIGVLVEALRGVLTEFRPAIEAVVPALVAPARAG